jgi:hypothetical protein
MLRREREFDILVPSQHFKVPRQRAMLILQAISPASIQIFLFH